MTWTRQTLTTKLAIAFAVLIQSVALSESEDQYRTTREGRRVSVGAASPDSPEGASEKKKVDEEKSAHEEKFLPAHPGPVPASRPFPGSAFRRPIAPSPRGRRYTVIGILGSDGIVLFDGRKKTRVRYFGVKAPGPGTPVAGAAEKANRELVLGKEVSVVYGPSYGTVKTGERGAFVFVQSPRNTRSRQLVNAYMIENGYASFSSSPEVHKYQDFFRAVERRARARHAGVWRLPQVAGRTEVLPPVAGPETYSERLKRIRRARRPVADAAPLEIPVRTDQTAKEKTEKESKPEKE